MSRRRQGVLFSRYSELPSRYTRRVTRTSCHSMPSSSLQSVNVSETSANPTGLRVSAPLKITSAISSPRSDFADCSPSAQRTASRTLDFPQPFGPTIAATPAWIQQEERIDHQLVRGIGIPALTANIVSSTIGAGIFVIPATVARGLGSAAPLAFVCCAIAMVLFVTCFAIAGSRVSLTGGLYAYVEVAFGRYVGFLAGMLYFLTAIGAVAGVVNVLANSVALVVPFLGGPIMRVAVMFAVYASLVLINIRGLRQGAGAVTVITVATLLPLSLFVGVGIFFIHAPSLASSSCPSSNS